MNRQDILTKAQKIATRYTKIYNKSIYTLDIYYRLCKRYNLFD